MRRRTTSAAAARGAAFETSRERGTSALGRRLASHLRPGDVVGIVGDLGAGKTRFVAGVARGLGLPPDERVVSPTYVLLISYPTNPPLHHVDFYRLERVEELAALSYDELIAGDGVVAIEWFERIPEAAPPDRVEVHIAAVGDGRRRIRIVGFGPRGTEIALGMARGGTRKGGRRTRR